MAKELVVLSWCDVCQDEDTQTQGDSYTLAIGNGRLLELELCERHAKPVQEVIDLLTQHGKPPTEGLPRPAAQQRRTQKKRETPAAGPVAAVVQQRGSDEVPLPCLLCNETFPSRGRFEGHLVKAHQLPYTRGQGLQHLYGTTCPECGDTLNSLRALSIHLTAAHRKVGHAAVAFAESEDKFGVVAEARQRMQDLVGTLL